MRVLRQFAPPLAQGIEQRIADRIGRAAAAPATSFALRRQHQRQLGLTLQDAARAGPEFQPAMIVGAQRVLEQQCAGDRLEQRRLVALDDPPHRQFLVPVHQAALARLAGEHRLDIAHAEHLPGAEHGRQDLARRLRRVDRCGRIQAIIAIAAGLGRVLPEMAKQDRAPAPRRLDQCTQRGQPRAFAGLPLRLDLADPRPRLGEILRAPEQMRHRRIAVAPGAAGFLIIGLDRFGQRRMRHEAHVRLVDSHAERDRRADHHVLARHEIGLVLRPHRGIESGVIGARRPPRPAERLGQFLGRRAGRRIDDAGAGRIADHLGDLLRRARLGADRIADIGAIEAGDDQPVLRNAELLQDIGAGVRVGGRGQRQPRHLRKGVEQRPQQSIVGPEVVPPFGNAMRLVDREQRQPRLPQQLAKIAVRGAFGRDIEQIEFARPEARDRLGAIVVDAGQRRGADAHCLGRAQLIVHQGDQRRHDDARSRHRHRRQLIA